LHHILLLRQVTVKLEEGIIIKIILIRSPIK
jgi:hypothetical protein